MHEVYAYQSHFYMNTIPNVSRTDNSVENVSTNNKRRRKNLGVSKVMVPLPA